MAIDPECNGDSIEGNTAPKYGATTRSTYANFNTDCYTGFRALRLRRTEQEERENRRRVRLPRSAPLRGLVRPLFDLIFVIETKLRRSPVYAPLIGFRVLRWAGRGRIAVD